MAVCSQIHTKHINTVCGLNVELLNVKPGVLREKRGLRVFDNMVLSCIFGPKRDEVTREWRKLHNDELNDLYRSPNTVRIIGS